LLSEITILIIRRINESCKMLHNFQRSPLNCIRCRIAMGFSISRQADPIPGQRKN